MIINQILKLLSNHIIDLKTHLQCTIIVFFTTVRALPVFLSENLKNVQLFTIRANKGIRKVSPPLNLIFVYALDYIITMNFAEYTESCQPTYGADLFDESNGEQTGQDCQTIPVNNCR